MQFVPAYTMRYQPPNSVAIYPNEIPIPFNQFPYASEDILVAGQRDTESRSRRRITRQQTAILENAFNKNTKPDRNVRQELAQVLSINPRSVQVCYRAITASHHRSGSKIDVKRQEC